jgi:hypothetical protein
MAQFNHWELGGSGQWMQGGMTMVGDMFNHALQAKVAGLCSELANLLAAQSLIPSAGSNQVQRPHNRQQQSSTNTVSLSASTQSLSSIGNWWPAELGSPGASGAQNNIRYAYFPEKHRLAVDLHGRISVYDTLDHRISGISQQQSGNTSVTFTSQHGVVPLTALPLISKVNDIVEQNSQTGRQSPIQPSGDVSTVAQKEDIFLKIERLANLKAKGILSEEEFISKKAELLSRL